MSKENTVRKLAWLTLLVWGAAACGSDKGSEEAPAPAVEEAPAPEKPAPKAVFEGPGLLLPKSVASWTISDPPRYFGPDNLYDLINGGAEVYTEMGLERMVTCDYRSPEHPNITVTVEIYDMGSPLGAFGRVARFLNGQADPSAAGKGLPGDLEKRGLFGDTDVVFWKGKYLTHLTLMDESPDATMETIKAKGKQILPGFVTATAAAVKEDAPAPEALANLPAENQLEGSQAWEPKNLAGVNDLGPGFSARYKSGEAEWTLFFTDEKADEKQAEELQGKVTAEALGKPAAAKKAGKRLIGYVTGGESLDKEVEKTIRKQLDELAKGLR